METEVETTRTLGSLTNKVRHGLRIVTALPKRTRKKERKRRRCCTCICKGQEEDLSTLGEAAGEGNEAAGDSSDSDTSEQHCLQKRLSDCCETLPVSVAHIVLVVVWLLVWCVVAAVPCTMIAIGRSGRQTCAVQPYIPVYLIVGGSVFLVPTLPVIFIIVAYFIMVDQEDDIDDLIESHENSKILGVVGGIILLVMWILFIVGWTIAGSYWVYGSYSTLQHLNATLPNYCDQTTYNFSFWLLNTFYIIVGLCVVSACCCSCCCRCCGDLCDDD